MNQVLDQVLAPLPESLRKPVRFGLFGGIGCLLAALILGELIYRLITPPEAKPLSPAAKPVDVLFVMDISSSMDKAIAGVKNGITQFAKELKDKNIDGRFGMAMFSDVRVPGEELRALGFGGSRFTADVFNFQAQVGGVNTLWGGDDPESSYEGLQYAASSDWRTGADKVIILVTDAAPHSPEKLSETVTLLKNVGVSQVHIVCDGDFYAELQKAFASEHFSFGQFTAGGSALQAVVSRITTEIEKRVAKGLVSEKDYDASQTWRITLAGAAWTATLAMGVALALIVGQNLYLRRPFITFGQLALGVGGSIIAGLAAGLIGNQLFQLVAMTNAALLVSFSKMISWMLLGALIAIGLSFFITNLRAVWALLGGIVGGLLGGAMYMIVAKVAGELAGRLIGSFLIGFGIGAAIALIEAVTRSASLLVKWTETDKLVVNLGPEPVAVGSNRELCKVCVRTAPPVALKAWIANGQVMGEVGQGVAPRPLNPGEIIPAGTANIIVNVTTQTASRAAPPTPPAPARPAGTFGSATVTQPVAPPTIAPYSPPVAMVTCTVRMTDGSMKTIDPNTPLVAHAMRGLPRSAEGPVAGVIPHPKEAGVIGLKNLSPVTWVTKRPTGQTQQITPGATVRAEKGLSVQIGEAGFTVV